MTIEVGDIYKVFYNENNLNNIPRLYVLAIVDDYMVVTKFWFKRRRRWIYKIEHEIYFDSDYIERLGD